MTLESYLRKNLQSNVIDHAIRARLNEKGNVVFYIHPATTSGDTLDFAVFSDELVNLRD